MTNKDWLPKGDAIGNLRCAVMGRLCLLLSLLSPHAQSFGSRFSFFSVCHIAHSFIAFL
jgi:hypothetical protein